MSYFMVEYHCDDCGTFESLETRGEVPATSPCPKCGKSSPRCLSAVKGKVVWAWVDQGPSQEPPPDAFTTKHLVKD